MAARKRPKIKIRKSREGAFTAKAKAAGMSVQSYARKVLAAPTGTYPASTRRQANFARNFGGRRK